MESYAVNREIRTSIDSQIDQDAPAYWTLLKNMVLSRMETDVSMPLIGLYVVVDGLGGESHFFTQLIKSLGVDTTGSLDSDTVFGKPDALTLLSTAVTVNEADVGIRVAEDGVRVAFVGRDGQPLDRNRLIALVSALICEDQPGATIVTDSMTTAGLTRFISEWGGRHFRFRMGHRNVIAEAIRLNDEGIDCPLAIETTGHAAMRENHFHDDGLYLAAWLLCEALWLKRDGKTLSGLIDELHEPVEVEMLRLPADTASHALHNAIDAVLKHTLNDSRWHLAPDCREGVRILYDDDGSNENESFLLRASLNLPELVVYMESDLNGSVVRMLKELYGVLSAVAGLDLSVMKDKIVQWEDQS